MRTILAALSVAGLILLLTACPEFPEERCDHYLGVNCGNDCPGGCPDTCCCADCDVDTCTGKPGFVCEGCCCEEGVECLTDTCGDLSGFLCRGCCCEEGVECLVDTCDPRECLATPTWDKIFGDEGDDEGWAVIRTSDGSYLITGLYGNIPNANEDVYLIKVNPEGNKEYERKSVYGNMDDEYGADLLELPDGDLVIMGNKHKGGTDWQLFTIRTDKDGALKMQKDFGLPQLDLAYSMVKRSDGPELLTFGYTETYVAALRGVEAIVVEVNDDLTSGTRKNFGSSGDDYGCCIEVAHDGNYLLLTSIESGAVHKLVMIKINQSFDEMKQTNIIASCIPQQRACIRKVGNTAGGVDQASYVVAGALYTGGVTGDLRVSLLNSNGDVISFKSFSQYQIEQTVSVIPVSGGGYAVLTDDMILVRLDAALNVVWTGDEWVTPAAQLRTHGSRSLIETADGGFIMVGSRYNPENNSRDLYILKCDQDGNLNP